MEGTEASRHLPAKGPVGFSELPANEMVVDKDKLKEMPSNEPAGHEMETTENEMAALDRMARMNRLTDSTTFGGGGRLYSQILNV